MVEDNVIDIKEGRHPLQEMIVDHFVPNDVRMRGGEGLGVEQDRGEDDEDGVRAYSVLVLTGANACGKVGSFDCYTRRTFTDLVYRVYI